METFQCFWRQGYRSYAVGSRLRAVTVSDVETIVSAGVNHLGSHSFLFLDDLGSVGRFEGMLAS
jgi:hypothetical protein